MEAISLAQTHAEPIDLVLCDVLMPGLNGRQVVERLRELRPDLPAVFMSGYAANIIQEDGLLEEGVFLLQKPFAVSDLQEQVGAALRRNGQRPPAPERAG